MLWGHIIIIIIIALCYATPCYFMSCHDMFGAVIAQLVQHWATGWTIRGSRFRFPAGAGNFSLHHRVQNGSGAHPASYPMGTRGSFPGDKGAGA
jgi:hypothetical protein